jgi:hypothetical protein
MAVGEHTPFHHRSTLAFLEGGIITAAVRYPYSMFGALKEDSLGSIMLTSSKGQLYIIDLDASTSENDELRIWNVFKTNPTSSALCYSHRQHEGGGALFVGGEMCDTIVYWVSTLFPIDVAFGVWEFNPSNAFDTQLGAYSRLPIN